MTHKKENDAVLRTALEALRRMGDGHRSGDFGPYLAMLTNDYAFSMPVGQFRGQHTGREEAVALYQEIAAAKSQITFHPPSRVTQQGNTVVVEYEDEGTIGGKPYRNRIAGSFDVRGEQICGYREYFGDIDPEMVAQMVGKAPASK